MAEVALRMEDIGPHACNVTVEKRRRHGRFGKIVFAISSVCIVAACAMYLSKGSSQPDVADMYHMWLGPNGLPISPRKQRSKLFEFCTTHFVTEAESRYCFARLLSIGNPSGPVKYAGQPQYDSEQVVSPLFTFAMPAGAQDGGAAAAPSAPAPAAASAKPVMLAHIQEKAVRMPLAAPSVHQQLQAAVQHAAAKPQAVAPAAAGIDPRKEISQMENEVASLKAQLHAIALKKAQAAAQQQQQQHQAAAAAASKPAPSKLAALPAAAAHPAAKPAAAAAPTEDDIRSKLDAVAKKLAALEAPLNPSAGQGQGINSVFYLGSHVNSKAPAQPWFHKEPSLAI